MDPSTLTALPGADLVLKGLRDLQDGTDSIEALLVQIAASKLRSHGLTVPEGASEEARQFRTGPRVRERVDADRLASPADFIPVRPGWEDCSPFVAQEGTVTFRHYDLYAQALSKLERGHEMDLKDVAALVDRRLVEPNRLREYFDAIEPELYRFPAINPPSFRRAVERVTGASI